MNIHRSSKSIIQKVLSVTLIASSAHAFSLDGVSDDVNARLGIYGAKTAFSGHISNIIDYQYGLGGQAGLGLYNSIWLLDIGIDLGKTTGASEYNSQTFNGRRNAISMHIGAEYQRVIPLRHFYITPSIGLSNQSYDINLVKGESESNYTWSSINYHFGIEAAIPYWKSEDAAKCLTIRFDYSPSIDQKNSGNRLSFEIGTSIFSWLSSQPSHHVVAPPFKSKPEVEQPCNLRRAHEIIDSMFAEDKIIVAKETNMIQFHHGFGMWIRNNWGLWGGSSLLEPVFASNNISQPDEQSGFILETYKEIKLSPNNSDSLYRSWNDCKCDTAKAHAKYPKAKN